MKKPSNLIKKQKKKLVKLINKKSFHLNKKPKKKIENYFKKNINKNLLIENHLI